MLRHRVRSLSLAAFGSEGVTMDFLLAGASPVAKAVTVARIVRDGHLGRHDAVGWQLFAVVGGRVDVAADGDSITLGPGDAVQWMPGESHESVALEDSVVVIVESDEQFPEEGLEQG